MHAGADCRAPQEAPTPQEATSAPRLEDDSSSDEETGSGGGGGIDVDMEDVQRPNGEPSGGTAATLFKPSL